MRGGEEVVPSGGVGAADAQTGKQFELVVPNHCRVKWTRSCYQHYETTHVDKLKASGSHLAIPPPPLRMLHRVSIHSSQA